MSKQNGPRKGDNVTVEPIRSLKDIKAIHKLLSDEPRNDLLFTMSVHNGLRMCDVLRRTVGEVRNAKPGTSLQIIETKTGKKNVLVVNKAIYKALKKYLDTVKPDDSDYLFPSRQSNGPISENMASKLIKKWTRAINLKGRFGCHTPRKSWGYIQRTKFGVGFEILCKRYNHSSPSVTMRYLGIEDKEVHQVLLHEFY